ncbi:MAG: hypothetical protein GC191_17165 [Azospirillum sp.]|nr:hypothetical protein [Azospirillum sp.]
MSAPALEAFLARLYTDPALLERFLAAPEATASAAGLPAETCAALSDCDTIGLRLAAESIGRKRSRRCPAAGNTLALRFARWLLAAIGTACRQPGGPP